MTDRLAAERKLLTTVRGHLTAARDRVRAGVRRALDQENTPNEIAVSFGLASLYAALPTAGTAIVLFLVVAAVSERVSRVALLAALVVFNPAVKWAVYAASYPVGAAILGPAPGVSAADVTASISLAAAESVLVRQVLGNATLAVLFAVVGYVVVLRLARRHHGVESTDTEPDPSPTDD